MKRYVALFCTALILGCANGTGPQTKNDFVADAQITNTALLQSVEVAATSKLISKSDAQNLLKQIDVAEDGIKVANTLQGVDATDKLAQSRNILKVVRNYLVSKGVK